MKILLLGEYSAVHCTLARGLRIWGHKVTLMSNGDFWKNYPRDVDLARHPGKFGGVALMSKVCSLLPWLKGYDVVQLINPMFLELKAARLFPLYHYLRRHNGKMVLGAFGMDYYWVNTCSTTMPLRYSDFNIGSTLRTNADALKERKEWLGTDKEKLNKYIAEDADGIVAGLYEYWACYHPLFPDKTTFIPYPICLPRPKPLVHNKRLKVFIGINRSRNEYKGTDIMLAAAQRLQQQYSDKMELVKVESVPFEEYQRLMDGSDVILDQLYSYTPSMNSLLAMSKGIVVVGGGEPENYEIINEHELRPIINVLPTEESVYQQLEQLLLHPERLDTLKRQSIEYIKRHHEYIYVAGLYIDWYKTL